MLHFDADFEGGCIDSVVRLSEGFYGIKLRMDSFYSFMMRVTGCKGKELIFQFNTQPNLSPDFNYGGDRWIYTRGRWNPYLVYPQISYDRVDWKNVDAFEKDTSIPGAFRFTQFFEEDMAYIGHSRLYTYSDLLKFLDGLPQSPVLNISTIGETRCGHDEKLLTITANPAAKKVAIILAREDADELCTSWAVEGIINHLLSDDPEVKEVLQHVIFKIVPMVSIDGVIGGCTHSAGYGYGNYRYHLAKAPKELQNIKDLTHKLHDEEGKEFVLACKVHGSPSLDKFYECSDFRAGSTELYKALMGNPTEYWNPPDYSDNLKIWGPGQFDRFMLDTYALRHTLSLHTNNSTPERLRCTGRDCMKALIKYLKTID